ncbi:MAG: hypothetical protein K0Q57_463 [Gammaproteobacteria bacterium]|nr:hypothetical protein [Gammaproteobacteria bacterium]
MIKKLVNIEREFCYSKLYREDLEQIESLLKELNLQYYSIQVDNDYQADSINEINAQQIPSTNKLTISTLYKGIRIYINKSRARIYCENDDIHCRGVMDKICDIFKLRQRKWIKIAKIIIFFLVAGLTGFLIFKYKNSLSTLETILAIGLSILFIELIDKIFELSPPIIFSSEREAPSFWRKQ